MSAELLWDLLLVLLVATAGGGAIAMVLRAVGIGGRAHRRSGEIIQFDDVRRHRRRAF